MAFIGKKRLKAVFEVPLSFRPRFSSPYQGLPIETSQYQIKLENNSFRKGSCARILVGLS
jgi:hypothetical protein